MIKKNEFFLLLSLICSCNTFMWGFSQIAIQADVRYPVTWQAESDEKKESEAIDEEKNEEVEQEEKKNESDGVVNEEQKTEVDVEIATDEPKTEDEENAKTAESVEEKHVEKVEQVINGQRALDISAPMFPSKREIEAQKVQEKAPSILAVLDILKELEDANYIFTVKEEEVASAEVLPSNTDSSEISETDTELMAQLSNDTESAVSDEMYEEYEEEETKDEESDFIIDAFGDEEEESSALSMNEEHTASQDEEHFLTFDEEQEIETNKMNLPPKQEDINEKGQLSSIVEEDDDKINISRYTDVKKGQRIDFSYPGEGWVYLGEENSKRGLKYTKRKMENGKTFFSFKAEEEGNYVLNFSYFDAFSGDFIVDAVSVKILPNKEEVQAESLVFDYQQRVGKKGDEKIKEEATKADASKSSTAKQIASQESSAQDDLSQTSERKMPQDVPIDSDKVGMKVENENQKKGQNSELEKSVSSTETAPTEATLDKTADKKENKEKFLNEKRKNLTQIKEETKPLPVKKDKERTPSSKREELKSPYKEPEVMANVATLSVTNAGNKGGDAIVAREIITQVDEAIAKGDADGALKSLENFFSIASEEIDRAYLLQGKAYELNGKRKNIKLALQAYKFLTKTFPNSEYRAIANERIRYIEKFFVNIK